MTEAATAVVHSMRDYYAQRAATYERVYHKPERQQDLRDMEAWLSGRFASRQVLEVACGTGWWTPYAAQGASDWLATDFNPETLALAQAKPLPPAVRFATVDAYSWQGLPPGPAGGGSRGGYTGAFAGCWWSHVPLQRLPLWIESLHALLAPGARVIFLDNSYVQASNHPITHSDAQGNTYQTRTLDDGSVHEVLKNFPTPEFAAATVGPRARKLQWVPYTHYWILSYELA